MISNNPNTVAGGVGGLTGTLLIAIAGWLGLNLDPVTAGVIATAFASLVLFFGRHGFDGVKQLFLHGSTPEPVPPPAAVPPPKPEPLKKKP